MFGLSLTLWPLWPLFCSGPLWLKSQWWPSARCVPLGESKMPSHVSRRSWAGPRWEEFDPWYYEKNGELAGGFKYILRKLTWNLKISKSWEKDGKGETSTKQLFFCVLCQLSRVSSLFSPPKMGKWSNFTVVCYKWVESQPPIIVKILLEIRMRFFGPLFSKVHRLRSSKTPKRRTRRIPWTGPGTKGKTLK